MHLLYIYICILEFGFNLSPLFLLFNKRKADLVLLTFLKFEVRLLSNRTWALFIYEFIISLLRKLIFISDSLSEWLNM